MSTDHELLAEVRAALHEEVADVTAGPGLLAAVRRKHARRVMTRRFGVAAPVAVAVAVAVTVVWPHPATPGPTPDGAGPTSDASAPPVNAAFVMAQTTTALDGVADSVIYEHAVVTKGGKYSKDGEEALNERWLAADGSSFRFRASVAGRTVVDLSRDTTADVFVDYRTRTYRSFPGVEPSAPQYDDVWTPKEIQQAIAHGSITVVGPGEPIDGKATVKLRTDQPKGGAAMDMWVDTTTYLPVRWQWRQDGSTPFDVTWLPPTPENLAQLTTVVPPGFTKEK